MTRITAKFEQLRREGRKAFIPYITAGDPDLATTESLLLALADAGADVIELGVPFSDPMADGPVIQRASERALKKTIGRADFDRRADQIDHRTFRRVHLRGRANRRDRNARKRLGPGPKAGRTRSAAFELAGRGRLRHIETGACARRVELRRRRGGRFASGP